MQRARFPRRGVPNVDYDWTQFNFLPTGRLNRASRP